MATIRFTGALARHRPTPTLTADGATVRELLDRAFADDALLRTYILDDQGRVRRHVNIFVNGAMIADRARLSDPVGPAAEVYILQALSGG